MVLTKCIPVYYSKMLTSENCDSFIDAIINIALHELLRIT